MVLYIYLFSVLCGAFAVVAVPVGVSIIRETKEKEKYCTLTTNAVVAELKKVRWYWCPVLEYTILGLKFSSTYHYGQIPPKYELGQTVKIYYDPNDYKEFYIAGDNDPKKLGYCLAIGGIILILFTIYNFYLIEARIMPR